MPNRWVPLSEADEADLEAYLGVLQDLTNFVNGPLHL